MSERDSQEVMYREFSCVSFLTDVMSRELHLERYSQLRFFKFSSNAIFVNPSQLPKLRAFNKLNFSKDGLSS